MVTVDLGKPADNAAEFLILRAEAIGAYANIEQSLASLLADLLGSDRESAAIVFFRVTNAKSRSQIIEALLPKKFGSKFDHFWKGIPNTPHKKGLLNLLNGLDQERNRVVHWHVATEIDVDNGTHVISLRPPNFWSSKDTKPIDEKRLRLFIEMCSFAERSINMFSAHHGDHQNPVPVTDVWRATYQKPCVYPPDSDHPFVQTQSASKT